MFRLTLCVYEYEWLIKYIYAKQTFASTNGGRRNTLIHDYV